MAKVSIYRARRRSVAEKRALLPLQRQINSVDGLSRRKYLQDFTDAYRTYQRVISTQALIRFCSEADTLLVSDFHALDSCQAFVSELLRELSATRSRPLALLLESVFTRDQHIVDEWQSGSISDRELRQRLRFTVEWGYAWPPFLNLLKTARGLKISVYGADCPPRGNMRRIAQRDHHAAATAMRIRQNHPEAQLVVLFGESHLAPNHLPRDIRQLLPAERVRVVLQNVDALYFRAAGELRDRIEALEVAPDVAAVFNATPLEKWQSYRLWISRWRSESHHSADFALVIYDLIDALLDFLHIERYAEEDSGCRYFIDTYPEVARVTSVSHAASMLARKRVCEARRNHLLSAIVQDGSCYIPELNLILIHRLRMAMIVRDVAAFVHCACRDFERTASVSNAGDSKQENFYRTAFEQALVTLGSRVLYPSQPAHGEEDLFALYGESREEVEANTLLNYSEYLRLLDAVLVHRDYELHAGSYAAQPPLFQEYMSKSGIASDLLAHYLGNLLGSDLHRAYVAGRLSRHAVRSLFSRRLSAGRAQELYFATARRARRN